MPDRAPKNAKKYPLDRISAILSMCRALWGEVSPALRASKVSWDDENVHLFFYYDGEISEEDRESAECVATEFISCYPEYMLHVDIIRLDYPKSIPQSDEQELIYRRREP